MSNLQHHKAHSEVKRTAVTAGFHLRSISILYQRVLITICWSNSLNKNKFEGTYFTYR